MGRGGQHSRWSDGWERLAPDDDSSLGWRARYEARHTLDAQVVQALRKLSVDLLDDSFPDDASVRAAIGPLCELTKMPLGPYGFDSESSYV